MMNGKLGMSILLLLALAMECMAERGFLPMITPDETWKIRVHYRTSIASDSFSQDPLIFEYTVVDNQKSAVSNGLILQVRSESPEITDTAQFVLSPDFSLINGTVLTIMTGKEIRFELLPPERSMPYTASYGRVPCDFPAFPLIKGTRTEYIADIPLSGALRVRQTLVQTVDDDTGDFKVTCLKDGQIVFIQIWRPGLPFPVYGENANMKYELIHGDFNETND